MVACPAAVLFAIYVRCHGFVGTIVIVDNLGTILFAILPTSHAEHRPILVIKHLRAMLFPVRQGVIFASGFDDQLELKERVVHVEASYGAIWVGSFHFYFWRVV